MKSVKLLLALLAFATQVEAVQLVAAMRAARTRMPMCHLKKNSSLQDTLTKEMIDLENTMRKTELFSEEYNRLFYKHWRLGDKLLIAQMEQSSIERHVAQHAFFYRPIISFFAPSHLARLNEIVDNHKQRNK